jgi:hypothetical protein
MVIAFNRKLVLLLLMSGIYTPVFAGAFSFADLLKEPATITHSSGYNGQGGKTTVSVCIASDSESKAEMAIAIQNSINHWNRLEPMHGNSEMSPQSGVPSDRVDAESVLLHEIGHCIGLAHPNLASESGLKGEQRRYARALPGGGRDDGYTLDAGSDGVIATANDERGTDVNLHWFRKSDNDPFALGEIVDASTYSVDLNDLPTGHAFPAVAGEQVSSSRNLERTEAVMHQGIYYGEKRVGLGHDDVAMVRLAMAGTDQVQGSESSYEMELVYEGVSDDCDITVKMGGTSFAMCSASGTQVAPNHMKVTKGTIKMASASNINWHFNDTLNNDSSPEDDNDRIFGSGFSGSD